MYKVRRRLYSQNFLRNPKLVKKLIRNSSIGKSDTVLEIGPGRGIITEGLLNAAGRVVAVEMDHNLYHFLKGKFKKAKNLQLYQADFLSFKLPIRPYKVFANVPFIITSDVVRKLTNDNYMQEAYLIVQEEAAQKFIGMPYDYKNSMMAMLLKPWFDIGILWRFQRFDFHPIPRVNVVMLKIKRKENLLVYPELKELYSDFTLYIFNRERVAKLDPEKFLKMFQDFARSASDRDKRRIAREAEKILATQKKLHKIHRTRKDRNWKKY